MIRLTIYLVLAGLLAATVYFAVRKIMRFVSKIRNRLAHRFVAIDFETANSSRASVCALGMVLFEKGSCIRRDYWLIDPECEFDIANVHIHHITPDQIEGKPNFKKIWKTISETLRTHTVVSYSRFDLDVLKESLARYKIRPFSLSFIDVYERTRTKIKGLVNYKLPTVAEYFGISGLKHHNALSDAETCGEILNRLSRIKEKQIFATKYATATPAQQETITKLGGHVTPTMLASHAENLIAKLKEEKKAAQTAVRNEEKRRKNIEKMVATPPRPTATHNMMLKWALEFQQLWNSAITDGTISKSSMEDVRAWLYAHRTIDMLHEEFIDALTQTINGESEPDLFSYASALISTLGGKPKTM